MTYPVWTPAYVGVGSNLDDPQAQVLQGIDALKTLPLSHYALQSPLYRTRPFGPHAQPDFVNAVVGLVTQLDAVALLAALKQLESKLGRTQPAVRWGPRRIDFDLLALGAAVVDSDHLRVPHPGIAERAFVLAPLRDIAPDMAIPGRGRVRALAEQVDMSTVQVL
jgi:2-amino-4-hydroxy-6-hydroxymethyldihydropteridine diphosphokinase